MNSVGGYTFCDENLLIRALTHSSYSKQNYERLEFLGDSIIDFLVAKYFFLCTDDEEGKLTKKRGYFVSEKHLAQVFDNIIKEKSVLLGKSCVVLTSSIKCDIVEAIIGAIYLDSKNLDCCEKFIKDNFMLDSKIEDFENYKTILQEYAQANKLELLYSLIEVQGQAHNPIFVVKCVCGNYVTTQEGKSKQKAQQQCAKVVMDMINKEQKA